MQRKERRENTAQGNAIAKAKESDSDGTLTKVTDFVDQATAKISSINQEYDLVEKGKQAVAAAGDLSIKAIDKGIELNAEYKLTDQAIAAAKAAVDKAGKK